MHLFQFRGLLCQGPRLLWKAILPPQRPSFPHQRLNCRGTPFGQLLPLASSQPKKEKKKKKSCLSLKEKLGKSSAPYAHTGQRSLPSALGLLGEPLF